MDRRRVLAFGALLWAFVGAAVALLSFNEVNPDARLVVGVLSVLGPLAAVGASRLLARGTDRQAGVLLLVSVVTPTYFAYVLNVPALLVGLVLLVAPRAILPPSGSGAGVRQLA
jgi:hypothetical protein